MTTLHTLSSGSSGNALVLSCGESHLLLDAGISCRRITAALAELGLAPADLTAVLITHTHADHIAGLQTLLKRTDVPVLASARTARDLTWRLPEAGGRCVPLDMGVPRPVGEVTVTPFPTSHDAPGSCGFRLDTADGAVGLLTDTGYVPDEAADVLEGVDLALEAGEFVTLCGPSGSGKTTLLRLLKPALSPHGTLSGAVELLGRPAGELSPRAQTAVGFVLQRPEEQIVTDRVWHELAFGLESLGLSGDEIRGRVAEMAAFFGIESWFHRDTDTLSGGQKQLLNLASVMAMDPKVLLLDEPTAQLDPVSAGRFLDCLARVNRELGTAVLLSEHRLEAALPLSDRCVVLEGGRVVAQGSPAGAAEALRAAGSPMARAMPTPARVWMAAGGTGTCPLTPGEGGAGWRASPPDTPWPRCPPGPPRRRGRRCSGGRSSGSPTARRSPRCSGGLPSPCAGGSCAPCWGATGRARAPCSPSWPASGGPRGAG